MLSDLLNETKGFKNQITVKVLLKKKKNKFDEEIEFRPVYFNSVRKTVNKSQISIRKFFSRSLIHDWNCINEWSGWIIEFIKSKYINISSYRPLSRSSYMDLLLN